MPAGAFAAMAHRPATRDRRHGGQRHQLENWRGVADSLLLEEARGILADGLCGAGPVAPPSKCACASASPGWSPASTAASESVPPIDDLELPPAAVDVWPSMREATREAWNGWDLCSRASDEESCCWEEAGTRLALEEDLSEADASPAAWLVVVDAAAAPIEEDARRGQAPMKTFAEALLACKQEDASAPAAATAGRPPRPAAAGRCAEPVRRATVTFADEDDCFSPKTISHGWQKEHKASWNARAQRKLERQSARRAEQSCRARGWLDGEGCLEAVEERRGA